MSPNTTPGIAHPGEAGASIRLNRNLPVSLVAGLAAAVALLVLLGLLSWAALRAQNSTRDAALATLNVDAAITAVMAGITDAETGQRGFLITQREDYLRPFIEARARLRADLERLLVLVEHDPGQLQQARALRELVLTRLDLLQQVIDAQRKDGWESAVELVSVGRGKELMDESHILSTAMLDSERARLASRHLAMERSQVRSAWTVFGGIAVLLLLVLVGGFIAAREVRRKQVEDWLQATQAALAALLQGEHRLQVLGERVLRFVTGQLRAPVAAFHVRVEEDRLERVADFALAAGAPAGTALGEGLAGECARSGRLMQVAVPGEHLRMESALVSAAPGCALLVPSAWGGRVNAVLEVGLDREPDGHERELLQRVRGTLGVAVNAALDRRRLEELLEETQCQAEELQAQQDELKVANEELQEQGDALRASQARLEQQQAELEQTNAQLAEQARALEEHADRLALGEVELRARAVELQRVNDYKSQFLANMSHELRTPLNSSLILARLLAENRAGNLTPEQVRFAQTIHASGNDLLGLINDILDLSKIEAGRMEIQREGVTVARLLDSLREGFTEVARGKGLEFDVSVAPDAPGRIETDGQRALQILRNLLSNAVKFTASGSVGVTVSAASRNGQKGIAFAVRDTGIGIAREQQQAIFEAFRQADGSTHRKYGGTGLGLSISRDLAALLGGGGDRRQRDRCRQHLHAVAAGVHARPIRGPRAGAARRCASRACGTRAPHPGHGTPGACCRRRGGPPGHAAPAQPRSAGPAPAGDRG